MLSVSVCSSRYDHSITLILVYDSFHCRGVRFDSYIKDSRNMTVLKDSGLETILVHIMDIRT